MLNFNKLNHIQTNYYVLQHEILALLHQYICAIL